MARRQAVTTAAAFVTGALTNAGASVEQVLDDTLQCIVVRVPGLGLVRIAVDLVEEGTDECSPPNT